MYYACKFKNVENEIVAALLKCENIDINAKSKCYASNLTQLTPLHVACRDCPMKNVTKSNTCLDLTIVKLLVNDNRCNIFLSDKRNWNCLMYAIYNKYSYTIKSVGDEWAYQCIKCIYDRLMIDIKKNKCSQDQVKNFFNQKAKPLGRTPFIMAYQIPNEKVLYFLKHTCKVNTTINKQFKLLDDDLHNKLINI